MSECSECSDEQRAGGSESLRPGIGGRDEAGAKVQRRRSRRGRTGGSEGLREECSEVGVLRYQRESHSFIVTEKRWRGEAEGRKMHVQKCKGESAAMSRGGKWAW